MTNTEDLPAGRKPLLWDVVLPVLQEINTYGGNFTSGFICRAVIDEIQRGADHGDETLSRKAEGIRAILGRGRWPQDPQAFNAFFETYHEALFYILARQRGVQLEAVPETREATADFIVIRQPEERFELKTIDFTGGGHAYKPITEAALDQHIAAEQEAQQRGIGFGASVVRPHGPATNFREAVERVMRQVGGNVKAGQFGRCPTFLVLPMIRTAIHSREEELEPVRITPSGLRGAGHLWTIAAHRPGDAFFDPISRDALPLERAGILRDFPFVRGIVFLVSLRRGPPFRGSGG